MTDKESPLEHSSGQAGTRAVVAWPGSTDGSQQAAQPVMAEPVWAETEIAEVSNDTGGLFPAPEKTIVAPLPFSTRLRYAMPSFSTTSLTILISLYANDFYGMHPAFLRLYT
jgi:hypothetical protein